MPSHSARTIAPGAFAGLTNLRRLRLENNQLQTIAPGAFADLTNLESLLINNNHITDHAERDRITAELHAIEPNIEIRIDYQTPAE